MKNYGTFKATLLLVTMSSLALVAQACGVDTDNIQFDDDRFADLSGSGSNKGNGGGDEGSGGAGSGGNSGDGGTQGTGSTTGGGTGGMAAGICNAGMLACGSDIAASEARARFVCTGDGEDAAWMDLSSVCEFACSDGSCTGVCVPGETRCTSDVTIETCSDLGEWEESDCGDKACVAGEGEPDSCEGSCRPSDTRCQGLNVELCDAAGAWLVQETCADTCTDAQCTGGCSDGDTQCGTNEADEPILLTCNAGGDWESATIVECDYVCSGGACGGSCVPGNKECNAEDDARTCLGTGEWGDANECLNGCQLGECNACVPGSTKCEDGGVKVCQPDGEWGSGQSCDNGCQEGECNTCVPGSTNCTSSTTLDTCGLDGEWSESTCNNKACISGEPDACGGDCSPGAVRCNGDSNVELCKDDGKWKVDAICDGCSDGSCTGNCAEGETTCEQRGSEHILLTCDAAPNNSWEEAAEQTCAFVCSGGACNGECVPGTKSCSNGGTRTCGDDGKWGAVSNCPEGCQSGVCNVCSPGERDCAPGNAARVCKADGTWGTPSSCGNDYCYDGFCENCIPGQVNCNDDLVMECRGGEGSAAWVEQRNCAKGGAGPKSEPGTCGIFKEKVGCMMNLCRFRRALTYFDTEEVDALNCEEEKQFCDSLRGQCIVPKMPCNVGSNGCFDEVRAWSCQPGEKFASFYLGECNCSTGNPALLAECKWDEEPYCEEPIVCL